MNSGKMRRTCALLFSLGARCALADEECYNSLTSLRRTGDLDELYAQHVLTRDRYMCNGIYKFGVNKDGALIYGDVGRDEVIQNSYDEGSYLVMQNDGNLVFRNSSDETLWDTGTEYRPNSKITLYIDGTIKIKDDLGWVHEVPLRPDDWDNDDDSDNHVDCIGDTIYGRFNDALFPGDYLCAGEHKFGVYRSPDNGIKASMDLVYMQGDGYPDPISVQKEERSYFMMQQDGRGKFYGGDFRTRTYQDVESHAGILRIVEDGKKAKLELVDMTTGSVAYTGALADLTSQLGAEGSLRKSDRVQESR